MRRLRRPLLWLPLVVLTLFFALCGWRNWHLPNSAKDVWLEIPAYYLKSTFPLPPAVPGMLDVSPLFERGGTTILSVEDVNNLHALPAPIFSQLCARYPQLRLRNYLKSADYSGLKKKGFLSFDKVRFLNRFAATCRVSISTRGLNTPQFGTNVETLTMTRSPWLFADTRWRVVKSEWEGFNMN